MTDSLEKIQDVPTIADSLEKIQDAPTIADSVEKKIQDVPTIKYALLIGINYVGSSSELRGCINDIKNTKELLITKYGYKKENIMMLLDDSIHMNPTKKNIIDELTALIKKTNNPEENVSNVWISYSGHGSYAKDLKKKGNLDELDGQDETLVPVDYEMNGDICDDEIYNIIKDINPSTVMNVIIDACHSGTALDLNYKYISGIKSVKENNKKPILANIMMLSGCMDNQTSADAFIDNESAGALTANFLKVLKDHNYTIKCYKLLKFLRMYIKDGGFEQIPQLTCSRMINETTNFV